VHAPLSVCEQRDLKGIYRGIRNREIKNVTGVDDSRVSPEVECRRILKPVRRARTKYCRLSMRGMPGKAKNILT
jgi:adenylylsulfate kinase